MTTKAVIVSAPSGSGKTTIVHHLLNQIPDLSFSISATTRMCRKNEVDGRDYYFLDEADFDARVVNGEFLEWEEVYSGSRYGTLEQEVQRIWAEGKTVIFDVDVIGGLNLKKKLGDKALALFIKAPTLEAIRERLQNRSTETQAALEIRVEKAMEEMRYEPCFDRCIVNEDLAVAQAEAEQMVREFIRS